MLNSVKLALDAFSVATDYFCGCGDCHITKVLGFLAGLSKIGLSPAIVLIYAPYLVSF